MLSFIGLCLLLGAGHLLRSRIKILRTLYLPSCVIGGLLGLVVLTAMAYGNAYVPEWAATLVASFTAGWGKLPGLLIDVVFACLFIGVTLPHVSTLWRRAGPQLAYGQIVAWGQYVVGIGVFLVLVGPLFAELPEIFAGILPVGFEGGHGTAGGMGPTFDNLGWPAGKDFALASATAGITSAIVVGMILVNWAARKGYTHRRQSPEQIAEDDTVGVIPIDRRPVAGRLTVNADAIESFSMHLVVVALAVLFGYALKEGLTRFEGMVPWLAEHKLLSSFPRFPLCMLGGLLVQFVEQKFDRHKMVDPGTVRRIQNASLDFLVVAAIATISVKVVVAGIVPLAILVAAGILWNVFCIMVLARRMLPDAWFERSIAEMGQSMGITATGLLLLRVVDPEYESPAADAFAYKQLLHEPIMGGGIWTGAAIPLIAAWGGWPVFAIAAAAVVFWLILATVLRFGPAKT